MNTIRYAVSDLNGQMRGKRTPEQDAEKLADGVARIPLSVLNLDLWGEDIDGSPLVFDTGDADGILRPTGRGPVPMPWLATPSTLHPMWCFHEDGTPFEGDPRHALAKVLADFDAKGWQVQAATELEFHLCDASGAQLQPPKDPVTGHRLTGGEITSLARLDAFDSFFTELYAACAAMDIPAQTAISEGGIAQFEISLTHQDAMKAADDTWLFKHMLKGLARKHGFNATFMAKPYAGDAGNGLHVHFSITNKAGQNIFDDGTAKGSEVLPHAIAGCLAAMQDSTLIFAPHANSYERLVAGSHAPTAVCWGYENRTAALRIPGGHPNARRIEYRVAGGDTNPYLILAAILGAAWTGIEAGSPAPVPLTGNAYEQDFPQLVDSWDDAIKLFETSEIIRQIFPDMLVNNLAMTKHQERRKFDKLSEEDQLRLTLETV